MSAKLKSLLCLACLFIAFILIPSTASSELWPFKVGDTYKYKETDGEQPISYEYIIITEKIAKDSQEYYHLMNFDAEEPPESPDAWKDMGYFRSTDEGIYRYNPDGYEFIFFESGSIGYQWESQFEDQDGSNFHFYEIIDDEDTLDIEYGHYIGAYKYNIIDCRDYDQNDCEEERFSWIVPGLGLAKEFEINDEDQDFISELSEIIPPRIRFLFVPLNRFEDGRYNFSFYLFFGTGNDPDEGLFTSFAIPVEDFDLLNEESSVELYKDGDVKVPTHGKEIFKWNVSRSFDEGFNFESVFLGRIDTEYYPSGPTSWTLDVEDVNGDEYEANYTYNGFIDLPFISASSFEINNDTGEWIFKWNNPPVTDQIENTTFIANILLYKGESYVGEYYISLPSELAQITIPSDYLDSCNRFKLQNHIRMNDFSHRSYSNMISIPIHDEDKDGISDALDTSPDLASFGFTDGETDGTILDSGGFRLSVTDAASPEQGVLIAASCADESGQCSEKAEIETCGGAGHYYLDTGDGYLDTGDEAIVTCGSVILKVIEGLVEAEFIDESGELTAIAEIGKGNGINFNQEDFTFTAPESNTADIVVVVDDEEIILSPGEASVNIDIRPFSKRNIILIWRWGKVPVAILSTDTFYAPDDVNKDTITFGATGEEASPIPWMTRTRDINHDGIKDLICVFRAKDTGFQPEDTIGILKALKTSDEPIKGQDSVIVIGR